MTGDCAFLFTGTTDDRPLRNHSPRAAIPVACGRSLTPSAVYRGLPLEHKATDAPPALGVVALVSDRHVSPLCVYRCGSGAATPRRMRNDLGQPGAPDAFDRAVDHRRRKAVLSAVAMHPMTNRNDGQTPRLHAAADRPRRGWGSVGGPARWGFVMSNGASRNAGQRLLHHGPGSFQPGPYPFPRLVRPARGRTRCSKAAADGARFCTVAAWEAAHESIRLCRSGPELSRPRARSCARLWRLRLERRLILPEHISPSDLLSDWRAAERDTVASRTASKVAQLALAAATAAEEAALEVDAAATAAVEAIERARSAATQARKAATQAAEAAQLAFATAEGAVIRADAVEERAHVAEDAARERYQQTETKRFPKD